MSGHSQGSTANTTATARVLKLSPNLIKQGPIKATIPMASIVKNAALQKSPTSTQSSSWRTNVSPNHSGLRSPGSSSNKVTYAEGGPVSGRNAMRRTASLDAIYVTGQWPREALYCVQQALQIDKGTQTEECEWMESHKIHFIPENDDKLEKMIRQRLQRSNNQQSSRSLTSPVTGDHTLTTSSQTHTSKTFIIPRATPVNIPIKPLPKPTMRNSVEGLNQEIEGLVLNAGVVGSHNNDRNHECDKFCQVTPEGHRAPFPDLFRTRSVNTQTPSANDVTGSCQSSSPPSRDSLSPMILGHLDTSPSETGGSRGSSPDQEGVKMGTSPRMFLVRDPPDGCERVHLKSMEERSGLLLENAPQPCTFQLKPSKGSAFQMLHPSKDLPLVPSQQDLI